MRSYWTLNRTKAFAVALAGAAILTGPVLADNPNVAESEQAAALRPGTYLIQPSDTHPGYMLPPLSDHLIVVQLDDNQGVLEGNDDEAAFEEDDGTAKEYNRGYYAEPAQIVELIVVPTTIEAIELANVSDDGTATQYDRGYYKEPEIIVALIIVSNEDIEE